MSGDRRTGSIFRFFMTVVIRLSLPAISDEGCSEAGAEARVQARGRFPVR